MIALARTDTLEQRTAILSRLLLRNRLVGILRFGVPAVGIIVFAALAIQIFIGNFLEQYGVTRIVIDRNNLIVETPSYVAAGPDGTLYSMAAANARASFDQPDMLMLSDVSLDIAPPGAAAYHARVGEATLAASTQELTLPGATLISSDDGMTGSIADLVADLDDRRVVGGASSFEFPDGSSFTAKGASFDARARIWTFSGITMRLLGTPGEAAP